MANTVTLATLRTRARERSDMVNSSFVSSAELLQYINASYSELYDLMVGKFEDYYTVSSTETIAQGANTITLPTDFYKMRGLDYQLDANNWVLVSKFNFANRNQLNRSTARSVRGVTALQYRIVGNTIRIEPESAAPGTYRLWYTPIYTPLSAESDTVDGINGWEEYVVIDAAIKMLAKEESSTTHLEKEKAAMLQRIEVMAQSRDSGAPESITDVSIENQDDLLPWGY